MLVRNDWYVDMVFKSDKSLLFCAAKLTNYLFWIKPSDLSICGCSAKVYEA